MNLNHLTEEFITSLGREVGTEVRAAALGLLSKEWGPDQLRAQPGDGWPGQTWCAITELGWFDLLRSEAEGGLGLSAVEVATVFEAAGQFLLPGPLFGSLVAWNLLTAEKASGPVAFPGRLPGGNGNGLELRDGRVSGEVLGIDSADQADSVLVVARSDGDAVAVVLDPRGAGIRLEVMPCVDPCARPFALHCAGATPNAQYPLSRELLADLEAYGQVMTAARIFGVISAVRDMTMGYAAERRQFGRSIASFQAVRHRLADMEVMVQTVGNAAYVAAATLAAGAPDRHRRAMSAKAWAARAGRRVVESALQAHGGIGFTAEHNLHLYYKHALTLQGDWGDAFQLERRLGETVLAAS